MAVSASACGRGRGARPHESGCPAGMRRPLSITTARTCGPSSVAAQRPGPALGCGRPQGDTYSLREPQHPPGRCPLATQSTHLRKGCMRGLLASDGLHSRAWPCAQCQEAGDVRVWSPGSPALRALAGSSDAPWGCHVACWGWGSCPLRASVPSQGKWRWPSHLL